MTPKQRVLKKHKEAHWWYGCASQKHYIFANGNIKYGVGSNAVAAWADAANKMRRIDRSTSK